MSRDARSRPAAQPGPTGPGLLARHRPWGRGRAAGDPAEGKGDVVSQGAAGARPGLGAHNGGGGDVSRERVYLKKIIMRKFKHSKLQSIMDTLYPPTISNYYQLMTSLVSSIWPFTLLGHFEANPRHEKSLTLNPSAACGVHISPGAAPWAGESLASSLPGPGWARSPASGLGLGFLGHPSLPALAGLSREGQCRMEL